MKYNGHERSRESIESAYDKIIMESFRDRKKSKINLKSNLKKKVSESPAWVQNLANMVEVPSSTVIGQRAALFALLGVWSVFNPAEGGPAFQVSFSAHVYSTLAFLASNQLILRLLSSAAFACVCWSCNMQKKVHHSLHCLNSYLRLLSLDYRWPSLWQHVSISLTTASKVLAGLSLLGLSFSPSLPDQIICMLIHAIHQGKNMWRCMS